MNGDTRRAIEADCIRVMTQQLFYLDERRYDDLLPLFLPDATWQRNGETFKGRDAIAAAMTARPADWVVRHVATNFLADAETERRAHVTFYITAYLSQKPDDAAMREIEGPYLVLVVNADLDRTPDGWKISNQVNRREFKFASA